VIFTPSTYKGTAGVKSAAKKTHIKIEIRKNFYLKKTAFTIILLTVNAVFLFIFYSCVFALR